MTRAPAIGLRLAHRVDGTPFLHGLAGSDFTVPAGSRVQLRRLRPDGPGDSPTHAIVFAPPDPRVTEKEIEQAVRDSAWHRVDPRRAPGEAP